MSNSWWNSYCFKAVSVVAVACSSGIFTGGLSALDWQPGQAEKPVGQHAGHEAGSGKPTPQIGALVTETFERLKKFEGKWVGRSTKGWEEAITFKTIAQG